MASFDRLPADQRAVLELVLRRGRSYDEIAQLVGVDRAGVRERALSAFDALGPQTEVAPEQRALITDYLLGQLPGRVGEQTRERLGQNPTERAWARVVAGEIAALAQNPLPEIPVEDGRIVAEPGVSAEAAPADARPPKKSRKERRQGRKEARQEKKRRRELERATTAAAAGRSRVGGAVLLVLGMVIVVVVAIIIIASSGGSKSHNTAATSTSTAASTTTPTATTTATSASGTTATSGTSTTGTHVVAQVNLKPPSTSNTSKASGIAQVLQQGTSSGLVIYATGVPPNSSRNAYAVWLYNSPTDNRILGFVNPGVGSNGRLQTAGALPAGANKFKQLLVTLETQAHPKTPGPVVLQGALTLP